MPFTLAKALKVDNVTHFSCFVLIDGNFGGECMRKIVHNKIAIYQKQGQTIRVGSFIVLNSYGRLVGPANAAVPNDESLDDSGSGKVSAVLIRIRIPGYFND